MKLSWFCSFVFFLALNTFGQRYSFLNYSTANGLPQSQVTSLAQDDQGYLWAGTLGGLSRFNGKDFQTFSTENGLLNNRITTIVFIRKKLWVGHEGGVSCIEKSTIRKWKFPKAYKNILVSKIIEFNNRILIASNGAGLFEMKNGTLQKVNGLDGEDLRIRDLEVWKDRLFLGTRVGLLSTTDLKSFNRVKSLENKSVSAMEEKNGVMYITTFTNGLFTLQLAKNETKRSSTLDSTLILHGCFFDSKENLWVNTNSGLFRLKNQRITLKLDQSNGLPIETIRSVTEDKEGNIWLGSDGKGLVRFPGEMFLYYNEATGLISDLIISVNQDKNGSFWIGTYDKGLMKMDVDGTCYPIRLENNQTIWSSLLHFQGYHWFATGFGLVRYKLGEKSKVYYAEDGLPSNKVISLYQQSPSVFYAGGNAGVSVYRNGTFTKLAPNGIGTVRDFCQVGRVVYCASDKGLFQIVRDKLIKVAEFSTALYSLAKDKNNTLWIGTEEGLYRLKDKKMQQVSFSKVASSNFINFLKYHKDKLYVGTNNGLFVLSNLADKQPKAVNLGLAEGVVNLETNINSSFVDATGRIWFGTAAGLVSYLPVSNLDIFSSPKLLLKHVVVNYQYQTVYKYANGKDTNNLPIELKLPYSKNNISFEMDAISLANYTGMVFQFWLEGQEQDWSPWTQNTSVSFSKLNAGEYTFHARSIDSRGMASEELLFSFEVGQAFYRTWWFVGGGFLLLAGIIYFLVQNKLTRERIQSNQEKEVFKSRLLALEQKSLNASMNRHFIFNSLNSIQYFINTQDRLSANKFLTNFAKLIRKNLDSSEGGNEVSLKQEIERLELYLSLESMRFRDRFTYHITCQPNIDTESILVPAMLLQPFIENSIIHGILPDESKIGVITIQVTLEQSILSIQMDDNGIGIDASVQSKMNYAGDHRSQGMEITTKRIELLQKISNRFFQLEGPFQTYSENSSINGTRVILKFQVENLDN